MELDTRRAMAQLVAENLDVVPGMQGMQVRKLSVLEEAGSDFRTEIFTWENQRAKRKDWRR